MSMSLYFLRRRVLRKEIIYGVLLSLLIMIVSYIVEASLEIRTYLQMKSGDIGLYSPLIGIYSAEARKRLVQGYMEIAAGHTFSFFNFMEYGFIIYNFLANFIITLPVLMSFEDRKNGTTQLIALRNGDGSYLVFDVIAICLATCVLVIVPSVIYWGFSYLIAPCNFPLTQTFDPYPDQFFQVLGLEKNVAWKYLVLIIFNTILFISKTFLAFSVSLHIQRKVTVLFIPILYTYCLHIICALLGLNRIGQVSYFDAYIQSIVPLFVTIMVTILLSSVIVATTNCKERSLNE